MVSPCMVTTRVFSSSQSILEIIRSPNFEVRQKVEEGRVKLQFVDLLAVYVPVMAGKAGKT